MKTASITLIVAEDEANALAKLLAATNTREGLTRGDLGSLTTLHNRLYCAWLKAPPVKEPRVAIIETILAHLSHHFKVPVALIRKAGRNDDAVFIRHIAVYLCYHFTSAGSRKIAPLLCLTGAVFNYSLREVRDRVMVDAEFRDALELLKTQLYQKLSP